MTSYGHTTIQVLFFFLDLENKIEKTTKTGKAHLKEMSKKTSLMSLGSQHRDFSNASNKN